MKWFEEKCSLLGGKKAPAAMLHDSSGGVLTLLTTPEQVAACRDAASKQGSLIVP